MVETGVIADFRAYSNGPSASVTSLEVHDDLQHAAVLEVLVPQLGGDRLVVGEVAPDVDALERRRAADVVLGHRQQPGLVPEGLERR